MVNKVALITGSSRGLAVAFAHELAASGISLVLNYRQSVDKVAQLAETLTKNYNIEAITIQADMQNPDQLNRMINQIENHFSRLDILIHSAGPYIFERKRLVEYTDSEWHEMIDGNLSSSFFLFRKVIPLMRQHYFGRIITIGFDRVNDAPGWIYRSAYAAAKVGLASLTKTVAIEEREYGITANMITPGDIRGLQKESLIPDQTPHLPMRPVVGGDLAKVIRFLLEDTSTFVTGNVISVSDGTDVIGKSDVGKEVPTSGI